MFAPVSRAIAQLDDPVFMGVVARSVVLAALAFALLAAGVVWGTHAMFAGWSGWIGWLVGLLGGAVTSVLSLWLFLPLATVIATLFIDRVAAAVERRFYPGLPTAAPARLAAQVWDGLALGARVLGMQLVALALGLLIPGIGLILGWAVGAWALGRGLFVAVAMRRMDRARALALYRGRRGAVLAQGGLMVAANLIPLFNLLVPVLGTAAMVHVLMQGSVQAGMIGGRARRAT